MTAIEAKTCRAWSKSFEGVCVVRWECRDHCRDEGYAKGGLCVFKIRPFGRHCMCLYDC